VGSGLEKIKKEPILLGGLVDKSGLFEDRFILYKY